MKYIEDLQRDTSSATNKIMDKTVVEKIELLQKDTSLLFGSIGDFILSLGDYIAQKELKYYIVFKK